MISDRWRNTPFSINPLFPQFKKKSTILFHSLPPLQIYYEHSDKINNNRILWGNILASLGAWIGVLPIPLSITSTWILTVPNSEACFYSTNKIFHCRWIYTNCYLMSPYCRVFTTNYLSFYLVWWFVLFLLRKSHHCDDA